MEHQMILRIVYLEHYRYWITLNRGRLRTDHKTKFRRCLEFSPPRSRNFKLNDQKPRRNGINNTWDKPSTFQQKEDSIFLNILNFISINILNYIFSFGFQWKIFRLTIITQTSAFKTWREKVIFPKITCLLLCKKCHWLDHDTLTDHKGLHWKGF